MSVECFRYTYIYLYLFFNACWTSRDIFESVLLFFSSTKRKQNTAGLYASLTFLLSDGFYTSVFKVIHSIGNPEVIYRRW